mmetsp:Transcript_15010/g.31585  ORF Transcript_15010/g.31585 Transcript_15010/m.31585 type:complete len:84 (-) Transcript_15010:854-1105(-)
MDTDKVVLSSNPEGNQADCHEIVTHYSPSPGYSSIPTNDDCFLCFPLYASYHSFVSSPGFGKILISDIFHSPSAKPNLEKLHY